MFSTWKVVASSGGEAMAMLALLLEDPVHPVDGLLGFGGRFDREDVVVLVLEVAGLVARRPASAVATGDDSRPTVETLTKSTA